MCRSFLRNATYLTSSLWDLSSHLIAFFLLSDVFETSVLLTQGRLLMASNVSSKASKVDPVQEEVRTID